MQMEFADAFVGILVQALHKIVEHARRLGPIPGPGLAMKGA